MRAVAPVCLLLILLSSAVPSQAGIIDDIIHQIASIFQHYEEAPYNVLRKGNGYEERLYPARKWVCKEVSDNPNVGNDLSKLFWPLFQYISGSNDRNEEIPMTVPVTTEFSLNSATDKIYDMCFFLGQEYQDNPPTPQANSGVRIQERPDLRILTRTVGGYMTHEEDWMKEAGMLAAVLEEDNITVDLKHMFWVGYDSPIKFWNRRNEVWFPIS